MVPMTFENLLAYADELIASAATTLGKWKETLDANPKYAFEWSTSAMEASVKLEIGTLIHQRCCMALDKDNPATKEGVLASIQQHAIKELIRRGESANNYSTSQPSILLNDHTISVWSRLLDKFLDNVAYTGDDNYSSVALARVPHRGKNDA
jgi:hypothetical protein